MEGQLFSVCSCLLVVITVCSSAYVDVPIDDEKNYYDAGDLDVAFLHPLSWPVAGSDLCGGGVASWALQYTEAIR